MLRKGLGVPKVYAGKEIAFLAGSELLEHLFNVDVRHLAEIEIWWSGNNHDRLYALKNLERVYAKEGRRFKQNRSLTSVDNGM